MKPGYVVSFDPLKRITSVLSLRIDGTVRRVPHSEILMVSRRLI